MGARQRGYYSNIAGQLVAHWNHKRQSLSVGQAPSFRPHRSLTFLTRVWESDRVVQLAQERAAQNQQAGLQFCARSPNDSGLCFHLHRGREAPLVPSPDLAKQKSRTALTFGLLPFKRQKAKANITEHQTQWGASICSVHSQACVSKIANTATTTTWQTASD